MSSWKEGSVVGESCQMGRLFSVSSSTLGAICSDLQWLIAEIISRIIVRSGP